MALRYMCIAASVGSQSGPEVWVTDSGTIMTAMSSNDSNLVKTGFTIGTYELRMDIDTANIVYDTVDDSALPLHWNGIYDVGTVYIGQNAFGAVWCSVIEFGVNYYVCVAAASIFGVSPTDDPASWRLLTQQSFAGLPAGFTPLSEAVYVDDNVNTGTSTLYLQFDALTENGGATTGGLLIFNHPWTFPEPIMLDVVNNGFGFRSVNTAGNRNRFDNAAVYGTYEIQNFVSSILPDPAKVGDTITIDGTGLTGVDDFEYTDADGVVQNIPLTPVINTPTQVTFVVPDTGNFMGIATLYSGAVSLGTLTIYVATGSGIYRIVLNKRNDTLYDRETASTENTAIPEPFGELGYIGG